MSVKLYRHNKSGDVVAAIYKENDMGDKEYIRFDGSKILFDSGLVPKKFEEVYTPTPEAPEMGSDVWAYQQVKRGRQVCVPLLSGRKRIAVDIYAFCELITEYSEYSHQDFKSWEIFSAPKPIEFLPHEFVEGQEVLVRDYVCREWMKRIFLGFAGNLKTHPFRIETEIGDNGYYCCIPYAGNEHLEGTVTDGEHGSVPRGYVPPHVPKLGDDDYWQVGDELVNLADGFCVKVYKVSDIIEWESLEHAERKGIIFYKNGCHEEGCLRVWYHKGSYVREDGTVHDHIPTRPHKIEEGK